VNKKFGQAVGNEVLVEIGRRLRAEARGGDEVARPGGDEFGAFFAGSFDAANAVRLGERLHAAICRPIVTSAGLVEVGASIGLVIVDGRGAVPANAAVMHAADLTMQSIKREGGGVRLYDPTTDDAAR
jgi:diguanylate cyclase (GGDEF)-like protein